LSGRTSILLTLAQQDNISNQHRPLSFPTKLPDSSAPGWAGALLTNIWRRAKTPCFSWSTTKMPKPFWPLRNTN